MSRTRKERRRGGRLWVTAASGALCVLGLVLVLIALQAQQPAPPQAPAAASATSSSPSPGSDASSTAPSRSTSPSADAPDRSTRDRSTPPKALPASEPTRVRVDHRDIDGSVFGIDLAKDGSLPTPSGARKDDAAWFEGSPTPGEAGPAVIEGHVTYSGEPSVFFELGAVRTGDRVTVDREDGRSATFEVYDVGRSPKHSFPTWAVYENTPGPELRMITCGGAVDASGRHSDNVIVFARMVDGR
ncbi:class F sortase [Brachybacterium endophyticum]|uniref:Class F sortase n=1 Tax=Brachybacterium endophyticum TaxID=2182385 RepID=A0A2U2RNH5_9MICO|nr:class F sortase [Brachybacterium endophyticum]PWH07345.1 class F sortase [Brachybacterium endophyticum]